MSIVAFLIVYAFEMCCFNILDVRIFHGQTVSYVNAPIYACLYLMPFYLPIHFGSCTCSLGHFPHLFTVMVAYSPTSYSVKNWRTLCCVNWLSNFYQLHILFALHFCVGSILIYSLDAAIVVGNSVYCCRCHCKDHQSLSLYYQPNGLIALLLHSYD